MVSRIHGNAATCQTPVRWW